LLKLGHFSSTNENSLKGRENTPKMARVVDSALVERVIDENFMWNKYNSSTQNHSIDQISSFDELDYNFANAT
jgi:flagellar basal body P-ring protein FlgI